MLNQKTLTAVQTNASFSIASLRAALNGRVIAPGDADYDKARAARAAS